MCNIADLTNSVLKDLFILCSCGDLKFSIIKSISYWAHFDSRYFFVRLETFKIFNFKNDFKKLAHNINKLI